jgi:high affinity Mn2+ porin
MGILWFGEVLKGNPARPANHMLNRSSMMTLLVCLVAPFLRAQDNTNSAPVPVASERWNLYYQATSIGQYHGSFNAPYTGPLSLLPHTEMDVSLTMTLFFGLRLPWNTLLYVDPEVAGGRGFSNVDGLANPTNGELPRVATATPKPYLARLYLTHDFGFGSEKEDVESDANQLSGSRPVTRYTISIGRFSMSDFFDNNTYTHDPRSQFMGWGVMYNGAWDYPADTRGYTWGWVHEIHTANWSFRYGSAAVSKVANGGRFDRRLFRDRGDVIEGERRYKLNAHPGVLRVLAYANHYDGGKYSDALQLAAATNTTPDVNKVLKIGALKYGFGINWEQEIANGIGLFMRLGWNDGKTESFEFTAIDRLATGGISFSGARWKRHDDTVATELTVAGISAVHALYLARGGLDFLIGDGQLNYAPEYNWETYYNAHLYKWFFAALDAQHIDNPAYNHDRGPLWAFSLRLHIEGGWK